jgi:hypothetical protein
MFRMNYAVHKWDFDEGWPSCDEHFNDWAASQKLEDKTIYHYGTGAHHIIGIEQAARNNHVLAITASKEEYEAYVTLVTENSAIARNYVVYFGDIYLTNPHLLPKFHVVTLFHLCEHFFPSTASEEYGGLTDAQLLDLFTDKTHEGGHILFFTDSYDFNTARPIIARWENNKPVKCIGEFMTLLVYQKT